jgi:cell division topological specificity factor
MDIVNMFTKKPSSKDIARDRLKLVLAHDRVNCSPQLLEMIKADIMKVISNYVDIDEDDSIVEISPADPEQNITVPLLVANIAIKNMRKVRT